MGRCPHEDDGEQQHRGEAHLAAHRRPADHRREGAGGAADDDVLGRAPLEPHGVDEDVKADGQRQQGRRHEVDREPHDHHRADAKGDAESQGRAGIDPARRQGPVAGPLHDGVDVAVVPHVERTGGGGADGDAQQRHRRQDRMKVARRQEQAGEAGEHDQGHDPRFQQREVITGAGNVLERAWMPTAADPECGIGHATPPLIWPACAAEAASAWRRPAPRPGPSFT